jgi:NAD(P)-dependent dehydrogenase (short-subunit alcohol dehydrogenase family)
MTPMASEVPIVSAAAGGIGRVAAARLAPDGVSVAEAAAGPSLASDGAACSDAGARATVADPDAA